MIANIQLENYGKYLCYLEGERDVQNIMFITELIPVQTLEGKIILNFSQSIKLTETKFF